MPCEEFCFFLRNNDKSLENNRQLIDISQQFGKKCISCVWNVFEIYFCDIKRSMNNSKLAHNENKMLTFYKVSFFDQAHPDETGGGVRRQGFMQQPAKIEILSYHHVRRYTDETGPKILKQLRLCFEFVRSEFRHCQGLGSFRTDYGQEASAP